MSKVKHENDERAAILFPQESSTHTDIITSLNKILARNRGIPKNSRRFESDLQYYSYPDIFPTKLSELLTEALICLKELESSENYKIDFSSYHMFDISSKRCCVDLIGCLISVRYRINYTLDVMPYLFPPSISLKFQAIQNFYSGKLEKALSLLHCDLPDEFSPEIEVPMYKDDSEKFKEFIEEWITKLELVGL